MTPPVNRRALLVVAGAALSGVEPSWAQSAAIGLDGVWQGHLDNVTGPGIAPPPDGDYPIVQLHIDRRNVRVLLGQDEPKAGTFEIMREGTNAVITSIQSDPGAALGQSWVETWTFVVTLFDQNTLMVNYVRVVNNNNVDAAQDGARFAQVRTGRFHRVNAEHV